MTLLQVAGAVAVAQSLLIAIALVSKKTGSRTSNLLLSALFLSFALLTAGFATLAAGFGRYPRWYEAATLATGASFLIGPLLLLYVKSLVVPRFRMSREMFGRNFCDFINVYRIEESKRLLSDPVRGERSILDIAYEVGFNSKSTFNSAFKKYTGMKPSEFRSIRSALSRPA